MNIRLKPSPCITNKIIRVPGSKSETNRLLILRALYPNLQIINQSDSDDSVAVIQALDGRNFIDVGHAGTAMRFLTAYFSIQSGKTVIITGSSRMKQRPIKILVDALRSLGADIKYLENEGYPPLRISGSELVGSKISLSADVSSQYVSALLLIAPKLINGIHLKLTGKITSTPYINMTLSLLKQIGIDSHFSENVILVSPEAITNTYQQKVIVESDWSAASYFYSIIALSASGTSIKLNSFKPRSFQGDSKVSNIYKLFGVESTFCDDKLQISKSDVDLTHIELDLNDTPDIAQTIVVTCFGLGISCHLSGLHTLVIKETDRLQALKNEISKLGGKIEVTHNSLYLYATPKYIFDVVVNTYDDHRMAMAFAPLGVKFAIIISNAEVVSKSYPLFWNEMRNIGLTEDTYFNGVIQS